MDLAKVADNTTKIHADDSITYLFGSELYCGWCLKSFSCPVHLKIHCHIEHLATCSCGERYRDKETLFRHVARSGCHLPPPFKWSYFMKLPCNEVNEVHSNNTMAGAISGKSTHGGLDKNIQKTSATERRKTVLGKRWQTINKESSLQTFEQRKFCCLLCPFQCSCPSEFERHTQQKHRNVHKSVSLNSCHEMSEKNDDSVVVENDESVLGILSKGRATLQITVADKMRHSSPSVSVSDSSKKFYCEKHRSDDIPFIASCFSSSLDGKLLCCDLCGNEFDDWKEAAVHVYNSHLSALEQWRDTHVDSNNKRQLNEDSCNKKSAGCGTDDQLKQVQSATQVAKPAKSVCNGDTLTKILEHSSVNSEDDSSGTFVDPSTIYLPENKTKHKFTVDECEVIASSLCESFRCCNSESEVEISIGKSVNTRNQSSVKIVAVPLLAKNLSSASNSKPTSTDMPAAMHLISRKCKFCHRVCSTKYNCQKHEAICRRVLPNAKSKDSTIRKIDGENIFYCSFCGFSDSDQLVVNAHLTKPHDSDSNRLRMKPEPRHDYIGSMKSASGSFQCTLCGLPQQSRSKMLMHLHRHSVLATNIHPGSTASEMQLSTKERTSRFYSSSCTRSCPKCFRSFSSVANYLSHRAVCRAIQHRQQVQQHGNVCKYSYLFNFCEQRSDGRWKCKLCEYCSSYRGDLYKHIRARHNKLHNTKLKGQLCLRKADGLWQCKLCEHSFTCHDDVHKHITAKHSA